MSEETVATIFVPMSNLKIWGLIIIGFGGLIAGGQFVVTNSVNIASELGVSEKIIGLTIVAAGTSLPELVTSIVAAMKKNSDIAIGNVIGSNVFNILRILAISSIVRPLDYNPNFNVDLLILTGKRKKLYRWEAAVLFGFYIIYTIYLVQKEM